MADYENGYDLAKICITHLCRTNKYTAVSAKIADWHSRSLLVVFYARKYIQCGPAQIKVRSKLLSLKVWPQESK